MQLSWQRRNASFDSSEFNASFDAPFDPINSPDIPLRFPSHSHMNSTSGLSQFYAGALPLLLSFVHDFNKVSHFTGPRTCPSSSPLTCAPPHAFGLFFCAAEPRARRFMAPPHLHPPISAALGSAERQRHHHPLQRAKLRPVGIFPKSRNHRSALSVDRPSRRPSSAPFPAT